MKKNHKRISAAVLSLALGFSVAGAPVLAPMAAAQQTAYSTVDLGAEVSLTINKYEGLPVTDPEELDDLDPLEGFDFLIERVNGIDLSTYEGWEDVANLDPADTAGLSLTEIATITTDEDGVATIDTATDTGTNPNFTVGVYLVTEQQEDGYTVAPPFFVTLPFTDGGTWNYDQVVHPKNQADITIEKDVVDLGVTLGETVTYTISAPLPAGDLTELAIIDDLPGELTAASNVQVFTGTSTADRVAFPLDDGSIVEAGGDGNELTVTFGAADRAALQGLRAAEDDLKVFVEFETQVESLPADGVIENHASIDFGGDLRYSTDPDDEDGPEEPGTGTQTRFGDLTINKVDSEGAPIEDDATFQLYRCEAVGEGFELIKDEDEDPRPLSAVTDAGTNAVGDTFTTGGAEGQTTLYGVQVFDWVNGGAPTADIGQDLCVVETSAPTGYVLNPEPQPVTFNTDTTDDPFDMVVNVTNLEQDGAGPLPETGGQGTMAMIAGGLLVAVAGGFAALRGNRARG